MAIISVEHVEKVYDAKGVPVHAVRGVDLEVQKGEFVSIMGSSGSGKSTLLQMMGGLDKPTKGTISINGKRVDNLSEAKRAVLRRKEIGFVFQAFNLIGNLSVADNVELPALLIGTPSAKIRERRNQLLKDLGLETKANVVPAQLSGGQRQRVAIARALINDPAVLLADEPTGNLDSKSTQEVLDLLRQYHSQGQTIVLVTHDARVAEIADRLVLMRDGQIIDQRHTSDHRPLDTVLQQINAEVVG